MIRQTCTLLAAVTLASGIARADDWPSWRGADQTGATSENAPVKTWSPSGENLVWKSPEGGRTTPLVMGGRVYFIGPVGDDTCLQERVIALDAETGRTLWQHRFNVFFSDIAANRVGWTALCGDPATGNLYAHGTGGEFLCLDRDGKVLWKHSLTEEYNRISGYGGRLMTPMIDEDRVVISFLSTNWGSHAPPRHRLVAFNKFDGRVIWWTEAAGQPMDTTYATPVVAVIGGKRMLIAPAGDGVVYGFLARTGEKVWSFALTKMGLNTSPVVEGNRVFVTHSEENLDTTLMGRLVCIDATKTGDITKTGEIWRIDGLDAGYCSPSLADGRLYVVDNSANLSCVNASEGKLIWKHKLGRVGKGSPVVTADKIIYVGEQNGVFHVLKDAGDRCEVLDKETFEGPHHTIDELFGSPAIANGRVFFMTRYHSYCLGPKNPPKPGEAAPRKPAAASAETGKPARMLVVPGEVTVAPGQTVKFQAWLFDANGNEVPMPKGGAKWSTGPGLKGAFDADGAFTAPQDATFSAGLIEATYAGIKATARVRTAPQLPINVDFETMPVNSVPAGWSGVMGKTTIVAKDGGRALIKLAEKAKPSPVWRMRAFAGDPIAGGYTVQADVQGTLARRRFKPDMGVINTRYELIIMGAAKEIELSRWRDEPEHALRKKIHFDMKPDTWYRVKLRVAFNGDKAQVQGKVWPRDTEEPSAWTLAFDDPCPNREGSPGLYAYSNGTTEKSDGPGVFYDNFQVSEEMNERM